MSLLAKKELMLVDVERIVVAEALALLGGLGGAIRLRYALRRMLQFNSYKSHRSIDESLRFDSIQTPSFLYSLVLG